MKPATFELKALESEWRWARGLTVDLLRMASDNDLVFQLNTNCGPLWKQFRHLGGVHEDYLGALETGKIVFDGTGRNYAGDSSGAALLRYFNKLELRHQAILDKAELPAAIDWFGEPICLGLHFARLLSHETLHHGQLMLYWRELGHAFPSSWSDWGE